MPAYPLRALVLRKTKLGETDTILTLLAEDGRQVRAVAKGMRKPGSRFAGRLEPFASSNMMLHTGRSLDVVSEADTLSSHAPLREDYDAMMAASVVADLLDKISVEGQAAENLYGLAQATFDAMEAVEPETQQRLVTAFLLKAMALHGLRPELESCACCASEATGGSSFSMSAGGVLCPECGDASQVAFSDEGRLLLMLLLRSTMTDVVQMSPDPQREHEAFDLMSRFVTYHVPARLRALDMYSGGQIV